MRYALLIYSPPEESVEASAGANAASRVESTSEADPTSASLPASWVDFTRALKAAGALIAVERLQSVETATSVRMRGDEPLITDGPFIETKEQLLGFYLIEAPDLDTALDWAARMPHTRQHGIVEVRPIQPQPSLTQIVLE